KNTLRLSEEGRKLRLGELIAADLSDDGKWVIAADKTSALVLDVESGEPVVSELLQGHSSDLTEVRFAIRPNADGRQRLGSASLDGTVKFWGFSLGRQPAEDQNGKPAYLARPLLTLRGHQRGVLALAVLPQGGVVTAGMDGRVIFWPIGPLAK